MPDHATQSRLARANRGRAEQQRALRGQPVALYSFSDPWDVARFLCALAEADAADPAIVRIGAGYARQYPDPQARARAMLIDVQNAVVFQREPQETFQSAAVTLQRGAGDCDDSARALYAIARAAGLYARLSFLQANGQPVHVFCELHTGRQWQPAETTIAGLLGEDPRAAAARLGVTMRGDIAPGRALTMSAGPATSERHDLAISADTWQLPAAAAVVRLALEAPILQSDGDLADQLAALGLTAVEILDPSAAALDWPADWRNMRASDGAHAIRLVQARYAGGAKTLARDLPAYVVRAAQSLDLATPNAKDLPVQTLPAVPAMPPATESRSAWARAVLINAWAAVYPDRELTEKTADLILAVASLETGLLRGAPANSWNWGNVHAAGPKNGVCAPGSLPWSDSHADGSKYATCMRAYAGPVEGMVDYLRVLTRGAALAAAETGDPAALARAMKANGYYEAPEAAYAAAIAGSLRTIKGKLDAAKTAAPAGQWWPLAAVAVAISAGAYYVKMRG